MKFFITLFATIFLAIGSIAQSFEGKIVYKNAYKSKIENVTDAQFNEMMGSIQDYYIKNGDYKSISNGSFFSWQLYVNKDNKLYNKMANSDTLLWNDGFANDNEILKSEINKGVINILGYSCDELILTCEEGIEKYYFHSSISVDPKLFVNHKFGNWYDFLSKSNALPLKYIIDNEQFTMVCEAIEVKKMNLDKAFFALPENAVSIKSPY